MYELMIPEWPGENESGWTGVKGQYTKRTAFRMAAEYSAMPFVRFPVRVYSVGRQTKLVASFRDGMNEMVER